MATTENRARTLFELTDRVAIVAGGASLVDFHLEPILAVEGPRCLRLAADVTGPQSFVHAFWGGASAPRADLIVDGGRSVL